ncbi:hypothetical protein QJS04_geneDACA007515 [Acorus gramineus]|uniref:Uncharacterized protein n=1 Tax=Acorus gramineus TaxID=55184 RepID=A0AAV9B6D9_ACOGR|nr:hypothetical protein QJS04_geneDACA007515 [Acorus gramineus]
MLEILRSKVVSKFQKYLRLALMTPQRFHKSVQDCAKSCLLEFNKECSDAENLFYNQDASQEGRERLQENFMFVVLSKHTKLKRMIIYALVAHGILLTTGGVVSGIGITTVVSDGGSTVIAGLTMVSSEIARLGINIICIKDLSHTEEQIKEMVSQVFQSAPMDSGISDIGQDSQMDSDISDIGQQLTNLIGNVVQPNTEVFQSDD